MVLPRFSRKNENAFAPLWLLLAGTALAVVPNLFPNPYLDPKWLCFALGAAWAALYLTRKDFFVPGRLTLLLTAACSAGALWNFGVGTVWAALEWAGWFVVFCYSRALAIENSACFSAETKKIAQTTSVALLVLIAIQLATRGSAGYPGATMRYLTGPFENPNFLGELLAMLLLLQYALRGSRALSLLLLGALVLTGARGAFLGLILSIVVHRLFVKKDKPKSHWLAAGFVVAALLIVRSDGRLSLRAFSEGGVPQAKVSSLAVRGARWLNTIALIREHPLGVGPGRYEIVYNRYSESVVVDHEIRGGIRSRSPHNSFLEVFSTYGWLAGFLFLLFSRKLLKQAVRVRETVPLGLLFVVWLYVDSFFAFPMELPTPFAWIAVFIGFLSGSARSLDHQF